MSEIEARAAAATPGPMRALGTGRLGWDLEPEVYSGEEWYGVRGMFARVADAVFYTAARTDVPTLVEEVRRLQALCAQVRPALDDLLEEYHDLACHETGWLADLNDPVYAAALAALRALEALATPAPGADGCRGDQP